MLSFKKNQKSQDFDITNVGKLKLMERATSNKEKKPSQTKRTATPPPRKRGKNPSTLAQGLVVNPQGGRDEILKARIARRAFEIYEERCQLGASLQDWLRAEREILAEIEYEG